jgi:predicted ATPase with chaperone activity
MKIEIESTGPTTNPKVVIVGLPGTTVKKSRDRVTTAIARGGYFGRTRRKGKSMSPCPIRKGTNLRFTGCAWHDRRFPCPLV